MVADEDVRYAAAMFDVRRACEVLRRFMELVYGLRS